MSGRLEVWECPSCLTRFSIVEPAFEGAEGPICPHCEGQDCEHVGPLSEWRPIHEAPRDGSVLLLFMPSWYQGKGGIAVGTRQFGEWVTIPLGRCEPTHWMPLPEPPEPAKEESDAV